MKIAFISRIMFLSGVTTHMRDLAKELIKLGHSVSIITSGGVESEGMLDLMEELKNLGVRFIQINYPNISSRGFGKFRYAWMLLKSIYPTYKILKKEKFDVIHVHSCVLSFIPKMFGFKFITTIHAWLELGILRCKSNYQIAISSEIYDDCLRNGMDESHLFLIKHGVDKKYLNQITYEAKQVLKRGYNLPEDLVLIGFCGALCRSKGLDILIKAGNILRKRGDKFHIVMLGGYFSNEGKNWLDSVISENDAQSWTSIIGFQSPEMLYKIFDVFVLPSRREGFGLVSIEAMLSGCCCVRSNSEGAYDMYEHGETGFIFENENCEELADVLHDLINDNEKRIRVAKAGQLFAEKNFTSEIMARKTLEVYEKIIE